MPARKFVALVSSDQPERIFPPFILALGARAMDMDAMMFFTMSGLRALVKGGAEQIELGGKNLADMLKQAIELGVRLVACSTALEAMGISQDELIEQVEVAGVATYLSEAGDDAISNAF